MGDEGRLGTHAEPVTDTFVDYRVITMIKLKAESSLEMELLMRSKRVIEELSMDNVFLEFLALQSFRGALYFRRTGFEPAFSRRNGRYGFEAIRPVIHLSGRDAMFALAVSVVTVEGQ
jgi:hypothetical protein